MAGIGLTNGTAYFAIHTPETNGVYDLFATTNLSPNAPGLNLTNWLWLLRTEPGQTNLVVTNLAAAQCFFMLGKTNDTDGDRMSDAYERLVSHTDPNTPDAPVITFQPLSQTADWGDTVTFTVVAQGAPPLSYQWSSNGTAIEGETNASLTLASVQDPQAGDYFVRVTSPVGLSVLSSNATLTVRYPPNWPVVTLTGPRQNYTFKNGATYYVCSRVELYGTTTIEGGAVIKPDCHYTDSTLAVMGTLVCKTADAYFPAFLTSVDDDTVGDPLYFYDGGPVAATNGSPYLDLTYAQDAQPVLDNLRIRYADQGVTTPVAARRLDVWDCQFFGCNAAIMAGQGATAAFHNVLFAACGSAVAGSTNFAAITGEHVTADVTNFWVQAPPARISLTNSIVIGTLGSGPALVTDHCAINPASPVFQPVGAGNYYLTNNSPFQKAGTANISPRLLTEFHQKTTQPPIVLPALMQVFGDLTLSPQAARYTNGAPDLGYYYAALDYTVAWMTAAGGTITILPGTAVGFRNEYIPDWYCYTDEGFLLQQGASFVSHGTPTKPNIFTVEKLVQEFPETDFSYFLYNYTPFWFDMISFSKVLGDSTAPSLDFRFSKFYLPPNDYHIWSGMDEYDFCAVSDSSSMYLSLQDCQVHGGRINLGIPDYYRYDPSQVFAPGAVTWVNNSFENVNINLDPTFYWYNQVVNCDMQVQAYNNLFRGGLWFRLEPFPASAGNWVFKDNLFDKVDFIQYTNAPLDFSYNGYWPLSASELGWDWRCYSWNETNASRLNVTTNGGGGNEQFLSAAPPYQTGPFGNYYLPNMTTLYNAGSTNAGALGLYHYTTRVDQVKEGDEPTGHNVNIGMHYVAANTNGQPVDTDGDGVPDYLENWHGNGIYDPATESDWRTPETNGVYFRGLTNGMVLGGVVSLPVEMYGVSTDQIAGTTFYAGDQPLIGAAAQNNYSLWLNWRMNWDTRMMPNGTYTISPEADFVTDDPIPGSTISVTVSNAISFPNYLTRFFGDQMWIYAQVTTPDADYEIDMYDDGGNYLGAFTGSADDNGVISFTWDLTDGGSYTFTNDTFRGDFYITPSGMHLNGKGSPAATQFWAREYSFAGEGNFVVGWCRPDTIPQDAVKANLMVAEGVVDMLANSYTLSPGNPQYSDTAFQMYDGDTKATLLNSIRDQDYHNFYFFGHGSPYKIGGTSGDPTITYREISHALVNYFITATPWDGHPYRFVFIDGCNAGKAAFCEAFGIPAQTVNRSFFTAADLRSRAFLGFKENATFNPAQWGQRTDMLANFFFDWVRNNLSLSQCVSNAVNFTPNRMDSSWVIYGATNLTRGLP